MIENHTSIIFNCEYLSPSPPRVLRPCTVCPLSFLSVGRFNRQGTSVSSNNFSRFFYQKYLHLLNFLLLPNYLYLQKTHLAWNSNTNEKQEKSLKLFVNVFQQVYVDAKNHLSTVKQYLMVSKRKQAVTGVKFLQNRQAEMLNLYNQKQR